MNDEIREILYVLKHIVIGRASRLTCREADKLLDYITNLQQENDMLKQGVKDTYDTSQEMLAEKQQEIERIEKEYKNKIDEIGKLTSKIYKASDKLKRDYYINYNEHNDNVIDEVLNILQNGSEEK